MSMKVTIKMNSILRKKIRYHFFKVINLRMKVFRRILPTFIKVESRNI